MTVSTYPLRRVVLGDHKFECMQCGFDGLRSEMVKQWDGLIVHPRCFDPRDRTQRPRRHRPERTRRLETNPPSETAENYLLNEDGGFIVTEDGASVILLE
jgi:hypothetical protein